MMTPELIVNLGKHALEVTLVMMSLLLLPALLVGLLVSIVQAATQINEMTLSFIPKLLVTAAVLVLGGPFLLRVLTDYTVQVFNQIPALAH
jgi:flagellar biosynthesis protein FliQ